MKQVTFLQGSDEWLANRRKKFNASEAPVMMAASSKMRRDELLAAKAGYGDREYSDFVQRLFDKGHEAEALARALLEEDLGEELYPVSGETDCGRYAASYDGLTMLENIGFEHKLWNEQLAEAVRSNELPPEYYWQLEHQLLVNPDIEVIYFVVSDGTRENREILEYRAVKGRDLELIRGWAQFEKDLESYEHEVHPEKLEGAAIESFPALTVSLVGEVKSSNLPVFRNAALDFINSINTNLETDQDFADAEEAVKFCDRTEKEIDVVKKAALAQTSSIEELFRTLDDIKETMRKKRLALNKLVSQRKDEIRAELVRNGVEQFRQAVAEANNEFAPVRITVAQPDFTGAIKGKRTMASLKGAVNDELAKAKIILTENRDHVRKSIQIVRSAGEDYQFLFNDIQSLVDKPHDHIELLVKTRVNDHKAAEEARIEREAQAKADRMREEERQREAAEAKRQADAAREKERVDAQDVADAERQRVDAAIERESTSTQKPTDPVAQEKHPAPTPIASKPAQQAKQTRPSDAEIIETLALKYRVHESKVIEWLCDIDLSEASEKMAANL